MSLMNYMKGIRFYIIVFFLNGLMDFAYAVDVTNAVVQGFHSSEAGVVGQNLNNNPPPSEFKKLPALSPKPTPPAISAEAAKYSFVLHGIAIEGNKTFTTESLQAIFKPYFNQTITVAKLQELVQSITDKYEKAGYFLSKAFLPPQEIVNGIVKIRIVEGYFSQIQIQGVKRQRLIDFINKYGDEIKAIRPIQLKKLERYLLLLNDISGFKVKSVIEPDPTTPLGSKLTLVATLAPVQATITQDNYQTPYLGPDETTIYGSLNSVLIPGGTLYARALNSDKDRKLAYYEVRHDQTIGTSGLVFTVDAYSTKTHPEFVLTPLNIHSSSEDVNGLLSYPIIRSRETNLSIQGQFDYMNNYSNALGQQLYYDQIRRFILSANYSDNLWKGNDNLNLAFDQGLSNLGHNKFHSRVGAVGNYSKIVGLASRTQFLTDHLSLYGFVTAQYANHILPSAETFTFGGPYLGRGYDWSQFIGDNGVAGKAEFRITFNPNLPFLKQIQYYTFYDVGVLTSLIPRVTRVSGASTGFGLRSMIVDHINFEGFFGKPLTAPNASQVLKGKSGHDFLGFFQATAYF